MKAFEQIYMEDERHMAQTQTLVAILERLLN